MNTHTPGPWRCNYGNGTNLTHDVTIWGLGGRTVIGELCSDPAFGPVPSNSEMAANARLIAAAPELLEALEEIAEQLELEGPSCSDILAAARSTIAKVRGQE